MTIPHLAMEEFLQAAAIEIKDIPFQHSQGAGLQLFWKIYAINIFALIKTHDKVGALSSIRNAAYRVAVAVA